MYLFIKMENAKNQKLSKITNIHFLLDIVSDSFANLNIVKTFTVFHSLSNFLFLIYASENKSIIIYNLINNQKINEIKSGHARYITNFVHYLDKINKRDLIMSVSNEDNNIKIWTIDKLECILNILNVNNNGYLFSTCFLNESNQNYIITSNCNFYGVCEPIKVYNFENIKIKEMKESKEMVFFIDNYYDKKNKKNYLYNIYLIFCH